MDERLVGEAERLGQTLLPLAEAGHPGRVNRDLVMALGDVGLLDRLFTPSGFTALDLCSIRQGLARVCTEAETAFAVQGLGGTPIAMDGGARSGSAGSLRYDVARQLPLSPSLSPVPAPTSPPCNSVPKPTEPGFDSPGRRPTSPTRPMPMW